MMNLNLKNINDERLIINFEDVVKDERKAKAHVILHLAEIGRRRLYAKLGYSSLYVYIMKKYHYSGSGAYRRIQAAKLSQRYPEILNYLQSGQLNLTTISLLEPHMKGPGHGNGQANLIKKALGKSKGEVETLIAEVTHVEKVYPDKIRKLPVPKKVTPTSGSGLQNLVKPLIGGQEKLGTPLKGSLSFSGPTPKVKIEFVADEKVARKIERAKQILRHKFPKGKLEEIINQALEDLLEKRDPSRKLCRKLLRSKSAQSYNNKKLTTRHIPAPIRRQVWQRDTGQCSYKSPGGKLCGERSFLQLDHIKPWALNGKHESENLRLLCRTHNLYRAQQTFGISQKQ